MRSRYQKVFGELPIIGMIHLGGGVEEALKEVKIFEEGGVDGIIVENYYGSINGVEDTLKELKANKTKLKIGVNILPNNFEKAFYLAKKYGVDFIQLDYVAGRYDASRGNTIELDSEKYNAARKKYKKIAVLGGVWPKYYRPVEDSNLEDDLKTGMERADAIVVTGEGTGEETPFEKIEEFRETLGKYPLIVGAGMTIGNACGQLLVADGAIVGTFFKEDGRTNNPVDRERVGEFMKIIKFVKDYHRLDKD